MANPNPALGISAGFDSKKFRDAIHFAMEMGLNPETDRRPMFIRKPDDSRTYWKDGLQLGSVPRLDRDGKPLDPTIQVIQEDDEIIEVDCAVEVERADAEELPMGNFQPTKVVITLLDGEYAQVEGCNELIYNGDRYIYGYEPESNGLFDVGVYTIVYYALDES